MNAVRNNNGQLNVGLLQILYHVGVRIDEDALLTLLPVYLVIAGGGGALHSWCLWQVPVVTGITVTLTGNVSGGLLLLKLDQP